MKTPEKGTPEYHRLKIALDTIRNPMQAVMFGQSLGKAIETAKKYGYKF